MRWPPRLTLILLAAAAVAAACLLGPAAGRAGTTGKIAGRVHDPEDEPIVAATISLVGTRLGAYSDDQGQYTILNVPAGTYELRVSRLGFEPVLVKGVVVSADQTTRQDVAMGEVTIRMEEVVVTAERPPVDLNLTSTKATVTTEQIEDLPVQDLEDVVNLQAGVVDGHFRGGRLGEVQYQVDGVSVNNPFDNKSMVQVDRSLLKEVQVISGTFDAEYGQAMSGVVNAVLKTGTEDFQWGAEVFTGGYAYGKGNRLVASPYRPDAIQNYQASLSGPLPLPDTVYLVNGRYYHFDDWVWGKRLFAPTDTFDFQLHEPDPTTSADQQEVAIGYTREWSGVVKLTNSSLEKLKLNYQALVNRVRGRRSDWSFRYLPQALSEQRTFSISHGLDATYTLGASTFLDFSARQNYIDYKDVYGDFHDPIYDLSGPPRTDQNFERGAVVQGIDFTRFAQNTNTLVMKSSVTSQVDPEHLVKAGGELHLPRVEFGTPGYLVYAVEGGTEQLQRRDNEPPEYPGLRTYHPLMGAAYVQDQIEWPDLTVRVGMRLDYLDARSTVPGDLANPANVIPGAPVSAPRPTTAKASLSPRLGVAYPIQERAAIHFAYGHFYQFPSISQMFSNADYSILRNLQAGGISYGVLGNPDVRPEETVQYEIGYKHALSQDLGVELTTFYKDIRDLLGVEFVNTYNGAEYARLTNVDFGSVFGLTLAVDHRHVGPVSVSLDYTWQQAKGNASDPRETAVRAEAGQDPRPRLLPFDWDQRHTLNLTVALDEPDDYSVSAVVRVASGQPYTPLLEAGFGHGLEVNSGRKPTGAIIDLRGEKNLDGLLPGLRVFARVFNLTDTRFFNGAVFGSTGSPYYSRFPEADYVSLHDPTRYYPPRRLELGFRIVPGGG